MLGSESFQEEMGRTLWRYGMRIYITHCSAKKSDTLRRNRKSGFPDELYTSKRIQSFMKRCKQERVRWAIFSDLYGVWFPDRRHRWYEKAPSSVSEEEFSDLVKDFERTLAKYREIRFYYHPARFHRLYKRLIRQTQLRGRVRLFTRVKEIV